MLWIDSLIEPITATVAILVSLWRVEAGHVAVLSIPVAFAVQRWRYRKRNRLSQSSAR